MPSQRFSRILLSTALATAIGLAAFGAASPAAANSGGSAVGRLFGDAVQGSGRVQSQPRSLGGFDSISTNSGVDLDLRIGSPASVVVEADDNLLDQVSTEVRGHTLVLDSKGSWKAAHDPVVHVTVPSLAHLETFGSGKASLQGLAGDALQIQVRGSGNVAASGQVRQLDLLLDSSGSADLQALQVATATVELDGSGDANVSAHDSLDATVNGSGDVRYDGALKYLAPHVNGTGEVLRR